MVENHCSMGFRKALNAGISLSENLQILLSMGFGIHGEGCIKEQIPCGYCEIPCVLYFLAF